MCSSLDGPRFAGMTHHNRKEPSMFTSTRRTIGSSAIALITAAAIASTAVAGTRPDDRSGRLGVGGTSVDLVAPTRPDDRAGLIGIGAIADRATSTSIRPDDRVEARGPGAYFTAPIQVAARDGFEWGDAALGAAATLGVLLAAAAAFTARRRLRPLAH
jgi:hypothetical protein